jgi:hypothetical protein
MAFQRKTGSDWHQGALPGFCTRRSSSLRTRGFRIIKNLCSSRDGFPGERYLSSSG